MSKTITINYISCGMAHTCTLDACELARRVADDELRVVPSTWVLAGLLAYTGSGRHSLTPRGEDLLASIDTLPDDPAPESKVEPCPTCDGKGVRPLFVSVYTCEDCNGTGERATSAFHINCSAEHASALSRGETGEPVSLSTFSRSCCRTRSRRVACTAHEPTIVGPPVYIDDVVRALHTADGHVYLYGAWWRYKESIKRVYQPGCSFTYSPACPEGPGWYAMVGTQRCPAEVSADVFKRLVVSLVSCGVPVSPEVHILES